MRKIISVFLASFFLISCTASTSASTDSLRIGVISDLHYLSERLVDIDSEIYSSYVKSTGRDIADLHPVMKMVLQQLSDKKIDVLFISGDLTNHGERTSHEDLIANLSMLRKSGIRVYVIPGNHDVNIPNARHYKSNKSIAEASVSAEEFASLYSDYGYSDAFSRDDSSLSYAVALNDTTWLLCIDSNKYQSYTNNSITSGRILPETKEWAMTILSDAKSRGITVLGMMHHGIVEHLPYQAAFFSSYLVDDWQTEAEDFANAGLSVMFTGHFHANDITSFTSSKGHVLYDIETASLAQYPFAYRVISMTGKTLDIKSHFIDTTPDNLTLSTTYKQRLETQARRVAQSKFNSIGLPLPSSVLSPLTEMVVRMNLLHVRGDETLDPDIAKAIAKFAMLMGVEADTESFKLDYEPEDNNLQISLP